MKLKSVELYGFKSFAGKSKLVFEKDISAIVGPNGSGKSNISDAIRWVLGEQSAKSLRGDNMHDVIFSGTEERKQMNMASVSLTLDNRDKALPLEFDDVNVTRKVYRTGESEYLLNNSTVRLKDIRELFLDTGIGKDGYSIIGQGRIDEILSSKSEDRRVIFEEASGIAKYKYKKIESERKLAKTEESLVGLRNELKLKEQEVALLETQANNAREGVKLTAALEKMELSMLKVSLDKIKQDEVKLVADKNFFQAQLDDNKIRSTKISERIDPINSQIDKLSHDLEEAKEDSIKRDKLIASSKSEISLLEEKTKHLSKDIERITEEEKNRSEKININAEKIEAFSIKLKEKKKQREELDKKLHNSGKTLAQQTEDLDKLDSQLQEERSNLSRLKEEHSRLSVLINTKEKLDETNLLKKEEYLTSRKIIEKDLEDHKSSLKEKDKLLEEIDKKIELNSNTMMDLLDQRTMLQESIAQKGKSLQTAKDDYVRQKSQRDILYSVYKSYEGYYKPIQNLLKARDRDQEISKRIFGVLADLIEVDKEYKQAVDVTLGGSLQNIVVEDEIDAKFLIEYIKKNRLGRITFLPISRINGKEYGFKHDLVIDSLSNLVKYDFKIKGIVNHFLSRTLLVKNMDDAIVVSNDLKGFRIVTLDGDIINSWGSMVGGNFNKREENSLLNRQKEIKQLEQDLKDIEKKGKQLAEEFETENDKLSKLLSDLNNLDLDNNKLTTNRSNILSDKKELLVKIDFNKKSVEDFGLQIQLMDKELRKETIESTDDLEKSISEKENLVQKLEEKVKSLNQEIIDLDKLNIKDQADFEVSIRDIRVLEDDIEELYMENDNFTNLNKLAKESLSNFKDTKESSQKRIEKLKDNIKEYEDILEDNEGQLLAMAKNLEEMKAKAQNDNLELAKLKDSISELDKNVFQADLKLENSQIKIEELIQNHCDSYDIEKEELEEKLTSFEPVKATRKEILEIKNRLSKIGFFNFASIEEYNIQAEALDFMRKQFEDLIDTKEDILQMIKKLETDMVRIFKSSFKKINDNFTKVFQILFDGGEAGLLLDGEDVLTAGIEIVAKPPGKKLKNIGLLSGGEKALTAVALLFSIFEINPAPFCVLDEIDAALDEANIKRYLHYLRRLTDKTQFIIITHRKVTMEMAEILYGVTMEEKGISKVITLELDDYKGE